MAEISAGHPWFCYMLRCRDGSFYVGITNDLEDRIREHNRGKDSAYTAKRRPVSLVWSEQHADQQAARRREVEIKGWSRSKKMQLLGVNPAPSGVNPSPIAQGKPFGSGSG
jgi:predicted GIY-YIG superfamily endonuclease